MSRRTMPRGELHWRAAEVTRFTAGFTVIAALAVLSGVLAGAEEAVAIAVLVAAALGVTVGALRWVAGQIRERVEDRMDAANAAHLRAGRPRPAAASHTAAGVGVGGGEGS
jgi:hypothetical protein